MRKNVYKSLCRSMHMVRSLRNLLLVTLTGWTVINGCGSDNKSNKEEGSKLDIVGGSQADASTYSQYFQSIVSLQYNGQHFCGGTLVAPNKVLTAAHCLADFSPSEIKSYIKVVIGARDLRSTSGAERFAIASSSINSRYNASRNQFDSAVIT